MDSVSPPDFSNFQIDVHSLPRLEQVHYSPLSGRYLVKLQIHATLLLGFFALIFAALYTFRPFFHNLLWLVLPLGLGLYGAVCYRNIKFLARSGYAMREKDIVYRRGYLYESTTVVPFNRIQHVSMERSFLDKLLKIATIKIFTAGGSGSDIRIPGLEPGVATVLKEAISERIFTHV